jgi:hypothetical protein
MNPSAAASDSTLLVWFLGAMIHWLAAHVVLAGVREARKQPGLRANRGVLVMAGMALGTALCAGFVLALAAAPLRFALGFRADGVALLWLLAVAGSLPIAAGLALRPGLAMNIGAGVAAALLALVVQAGWLWAAGFTPGISPRMVYVAAAAVLMAGVLSAAFSVAFADAAMKSRLRWRWRLAASGLMAVALVGGQELLLAGAALHLQAGSVYQRSIGSPLLSLVFGALVPLALAVAALDLRYGRARSHHRREIDGVDAGATAGSGSGKRRRRKRYRMLGL